MVRLEHDGNFGSIMSEGPAAESLPITQIIPDAQRRVIVGIADIRRGTQTLGVQLDSIVQGVGLDNQLLRNTYQEQFDQVREIMHGSARNIKENATSENVESHMAVGTNFQEIAPNVTALHFAIAASLQQASGTDYTETLELAKKYRDAAQKEGIPKTTPGDYLPDAYILGIAQKAAAGAELPSPAVVAQAIHEHPQLLKDYALVLSESQREEFLAAFPEDRRAQISLQLDQAVSEVLNVKHIATPEEIEQHNAVRDRVQHAFSQAIEALKLPSPKPEILEVPIEESEVTPGDITESEKSAPISLKVPTKAIGESNLVGKQITETLVNLGDEESLQILRGVSQQTTRVLKDLNKDLRKKSPAERTLALRPVMSFTARVLDTLIDVDTRRGGVLAMRYLEMTALPDHMFTFFARKLTDSEYFTKNLPAYLAEPANIPVLKRLMAQFGPQFNTIVDTMAQIPDYNRDHNLSTHQNELFEALTDLDTLTPRIYERYRQLPPAERKTFAEKIKLLKPQFFRNVPIKGILTGADRDILAEMVYMAYKPMGMTFGQVEDLIKRVDDHTDDISSYRFPAEGYPMTLEKQGKYAVREKQQIDLTALRRYRNLFVPVAERIEEVASGEVQKSSPFLEATRQLFQPATEEDQAHSNRDQDVVLRTLLAPLQQEAHVQDFLQRHTDVSIDNAHQVESELTEVLGVYFRDNYTRVLTDYLSTHPDDFLQIMAVLNDSEVRATLDNRFTQFYGNVDWQEIDNARAVPVGLKRFFGRPSSPPYGSVANIITELLDKEQVEPVRKHIQSELSKFALAGTDAGVAYQGGIKAYISKNVGSFFAKAAAGICTKEDVPLFERDDHFHINVVENDEAVRANIQAYTANVDGRPSLVLRGFNPTPDWLGKIDVESFCEQIIAIGKQFQQENGLGGVYLSEQLGGWHALSNRDPVARYLMRKYEDGRKGVNLHLRIASSQDINTVYPV